MRWRRNQVVADKIGDGSNMSVVKSNNAAKTVGIAPKVALPTAGLVALGAVLLVLDAAGVVDIQDEIWITLLGAGLGVGGIGYTAPPSLQAEPTTPVVTTPRA
jgi:hypothetical protein